MATLNDLVFLFVDWRRCRPRGSPLSQQTPKKQLMNHDTEQNITYQVKIGVNCLLFSFS